MFSVCKRLDVLSLLFIKPRLSFFSINFIMFAIVDLEILEAFMGKMNFGLKADTLVERSMLSPL